MPRLKVTRRVLVAVVASAFLAVGFFSLNASQRDASAAGGSSPVGMIEARIPPVAGVKLAADTGLFPPLPSESAHFRDVLEQLQGREADGDPQAMCRLAVEWRRCARLERQRFDYMMWLDQRAEAARMPRRPVPPQLEELVRAQGDLAQRLQQRMAEFEKFEAENEANCKGLSIPSRSEIQGLILRAARAGHRQARLEYLDLYGETWIGAPTSGEMAEFEASALPLIKAAVAAGDLEPAYMLARALSPVPKEYPYPLDNIIEPSAPAAAALLSRIVELGGRSDVSSYAQQELRRLKVYLGGDEPFRRAMAAGAPELRQLGLQLPATSMSIEGGAAGRPFDAEDCRVP